MSTLYVDSFTQQRSWLFRRSRLLGRAPIELLDHYLVQATRGFLSLSPQDEVLEVGCDRGHLLTVLSPLCRRAVGVDINADAVAARVHPEVYCMAADALRFPDASFDKIVSLHTIEHIADLGPVFAELRRVLRPRGTIVLGYPCEVIRGISALPTALVMYRSARMARRLHVQRLTPRQIAALAGHADLQVTANRLVMTPWPIFPTYITGLVPAASRPRPPSPTVMT